MVQQPQRRRARAIAISQTLAGRRAAAQAKLVMGLGAVAALVEAALLVHRLLAA